MPQKAEAYWSNLVVRHVLSMLADLPCSAPSALKHLRRDSYPAAWRKKERELERTGKGAPGTGQG